MSVTVVLSFTILATLPSADRLTSLLGAGTHTPPTLTPALHSSTPSPSTTPARTALPTPKLDPTATETATRTAAPSTPSQPITAWLTYTNTTLGYLIRYPGTWFLQVTDAANNFITSFPMPQYGRGGLDPGTVKMDFGITASVFSFPANAPTKKFCISGQCGIRVDYGPSSEPIGRGLNRSVAIQVPRGVGQFFYLTAGISDPPADAERNAIIVEQIIASVAFFDVPPTPTATSTSTPTPTWTPVPPLALGATNSWLTYANVSYGYTIRYPPTWSVISDPPAVVVWVASFAQTPAPNLLTPWPPGTTWRSPDYPRGMPPRSAVLTISVTHGPLPPLSQQGERFCVESHCGLRRDQYFPLPGVNRSMIVQIVKDSQMYQMSSWILDPVSAAEQNAAIVARILTTFRFTK